MSLLPKKLSFLFLIFFAFLIFSLVNKKVYAQEEQPGGGIWDVSLESAIEEREALIKKEEDSKGLAVADSVVTKRQLGLTLLNIIEVTAPIPGLNVPEKTALGNITTLISALYAHPAANLALWTNDTLAHAGIIKSVYAQGIGFAALSPLLTIWKASRNIAYAVLTIVMIAIGFMLIFRMKIDPKTVISIQAALPKIVITLILITFSYPVVGFLVDMMYLSIAIIIAVFVEGVGGSFAGKTADLQTQFMGGDIGTLFGWTLGATGWNILGIIGGTLKELFITGGLISVLVTLIPKLISGVILAAFAKAIGIVFGAMALFFILMFVLGALFTFLRLLILLFNSYIQVLISLILGPIVLLNEAIPGRSAFSEWILNLIANLVVFPATVAILMFSMYLSSLSGIGGGPALWQPPFLPGGANIFPAFVGLAVIFMAPSLVAQIKKAFHPKPILPVTAGTAFAPLTGAVGTGMGAMQSFYYFKATAGGLPVIGKYLAGGQEKAGS